MSSSIGYGRRVGPEENPAKKTPEVEKAEKHLIVTIIPLFPPILSFLRV